MIKLPYKSLFLAIILSFTALVTKAQIGYDYAQYDIGFNANFNQLYGDAESLKSTNAVGVTFNYNQTPFVNYIVELQIGNLEGGDRASRSGRYFKNNYSALLFRGQLQAGELIDYSQGGVMGVLKNFYLSAGLGYIFNDIKTENINRLSNTDPQFSTPGLNKSNELFIPVRFGYELKFFNDYNQPSFKIDVAYQLNADLTDNMDGFTAGRYKDKMTQFSIGLKFAIGDVTSYRKNIQ